MKILLIFLLCLLATPSTAKCPLVCNCDEKEVNCRGRSLEKIPRNLPPKIHHLDLRDNDIQAILRSDLKGYDHLETLLISNNQIEYIDENFLDMLPSLKKLSISRNVIRYIPMLCSQTSHLIHADFHMNQISKIHNLAFSQLIYLRTINLENNLIQSLPQSLPFHTSHIHTIHLLGNPINCDCRWRPFIESSRLQTDKMSLCLNPPELRDVPIVTLKSSDVECLTPTVMNGRHSLILSCRPNAKSTFWFYRDTPLSDSLRPDFVYLPNNSISIPKSFNPNLIKCAIDHSISIKRRTRHLKESTPPSFTLRPSSRSHREGSRVRLDCEVVGSPRPKIQWYFNGRKLKPSRKYEMNFEKTTLNVDPFLERDVGNYTCTAENLLGKIQASAYIELIKSVPPTIIEGPESQDTESGTNIKFMCRAEGVPRPIVTWFFDGSPIPMLRGHFHVSEDEMELTISNVTTNDAGVYSCMAGNNVGSMSADARLIVDSNHLSRIDYSLLDDDLENAVNEAKQLINRAIETTRNNVTHITSPSELIKWFQFSVPRVIELSKAREIYEESIRLIQKHVEKGLHLPPNGLSSNVSFESKLARSHVNTLRELAGCSVTLERDPCKDHCFLERYRTYDGQCNNKKHSMWGASETPFRRILQPIYENGFNTPVGWESDKLYNGYRLPNPRLVSLKVISTKKIAPHERFTSMLMQWGQFIDHDMDFIATAISRHAYATGEICNRTCENIDPCYNIPLLFNDPRRNHSGPRNQCIEFERSAAVCGSGATSLIYRKLTYREQLNTITSYIDGSGIYGSNDRDAWELRDLLPNHGLLRYDIVSNAKKAYLPFERDSPMDCRRNFSVNNPVRCFLAGDYRANEQVGLISMHTIWLREHNRIATALHKMNSSLDGDTIFHEARKIVGAEIQHITYNDWLPKVLGERNFRRFIGNYSGYNEDVDPSIANAFASAAFRFGHTLINDILYRLDEDFEPIAEGHLPLSDAFFAPETVLNEGGIDPIIRGLFAVQMKKPRAWQLLNRELTEKLFKRAHNVALDLAAVNIQRGRDHALPSYTQYRKWCNLSTVHSWDDLNGIIPKDIRGKLRSLYGHPDNIDLFVGGITEIRYNHSLVGPTFACIIGDQFKRLREGDRFWYENQGIFNEAQLAEIKNITLARILCDNADKIELIQDDVFVYVGKDKKFYSNCSRLPSIDLTLWLNTGNDSCSIARNRYRISSKKRRTLQQLDCEYAGMVIKDGNVHVSDCTRCQCKNGQLWCQAIQRCGK